jgi:hypothetical protein
MADLSASTPLRIEIAFPGRVLAPGQRATFRVILRDAALSTERSVSIRAMLASGTDSTFVRLWPTAVRGTLEGTLIAPSGPGAYRLVASAGAAMESTSFVVDAVADAPALDDDETMSAFVSSRGGFIVDETRLRDLPGRLSAAFQPVSRVETWYPMRSAWWLIPFAVFLGAEWWWRRRRGLA